MGKRRRKESPFAREVNHSISQPMVGKAHDSARGFAREAWGAIRDRVPASRRQPATLPGGSFHDLRAQLEYKAALAGVPVDMVDPRHSSRTCPSCGGLDNRNRPSQAKFLSVACGLAGLADQIAAGNISRRAVVNLPHAAGLTAQLHAPGL